MQKFCPEGSCTNERQAATEAFEGRWGLKFSPLVQPLTQKSSLITPRWSSWATTANDCACAVLAEGIQSMSALAQYWL